MSKHEHYSAVHHQLQEEHPPREPFAHGWGEEHGGWVVAGYSASTRLRPFSG